ncbi:nucleobase-ascorbate transporter 12 [Nicotiana sylvestris]|uniref:Nucleobase-ascorbate transporter 12 n=1 Tax=Nicotiana sylvestris TaxID=4096 RepID=A0A1U7VAN6_NICSY|nr:PREDICTED: nucleobase-ascorbate transporter 12 [Nicotiana sylvestris]XP_016476721.1 PREDICTED: nucleobase-ascorbate transporter 12-like [Nicotiana tabacum]
MASSDPNKKPRPGPWPPAPESAAMPPSSWAKKTGFRPKFSGETNASDSGQIGLQQPQSSQPTRRRESDPNLDLEAGRARPPRQDKANGEPTSEKDKPVRKRRDSDGGGGAVNKSTNGQAAGTTTAAEPAAAAATVQQTARRASRNEEAVDTLPQTVDDDDGFVSRHSHMKYELRDTPGLVPIGLYGFQHYLSMLGSLILIPLVIVPAMGGDHEDTSNVVSTVLFVSGVTTLLHTSFGSRLPLIQGPSFVYLASALAIIHSPEFLGLNGNNFKHIMKELQGAIIISSAFQAMLGYSGLMSVFLRLINPVVVAPTVAAVGLSFYSYGFPQVGTCLEIGAVQILLVVIFSLYLRKISVLGHRVFLIYAVPLGLAITWLVAFLLTSVGAYSYKGCDVNIPVSNIISDHCRKNISRMKHCRVDTSHALRSAPWFRFPYPLQWGTPVFHWKMALVMCVVSIISSVDSVGSYHASSLLVASRPPTPGVLSRGIGLEGLCSLLAGLWGTGTGSATLTENVHTIAVTKMGSRRAIELGACVLIVLSLIGKVGGFIASIPDVMVAALLCFMWAMLTALGLSNLRYSEAGSSRNIIIVGLSLFLSLSIPAYFQQYGISPNSNLPVPSYFQPYVVASHGPIRTKFGGLNYVLNTLLSLHMVIAFLVAVILDNTVPGSRQERGVYVWSEPETAKREPAVAKDYELPFRVGKIFSWVKWVGL